MQIIRNHLWVITLISTLTTIQAQSIPQVDNLVEAFMAEARLPGVSLAIGHAGEIIYAKGFGYADVEARTPMTTTTRLRTASVAKVITATALGKLVSNGQLDLDAPIKTYIPYIAEQYAHLTCRQLAGHTSGMTHRPNGRGYKKQHYETIRPTVELIQAPLLFTPDTDYRYSTNAFNLLAAAIEGAAQGSYHTYLQSSVFAPLGMSNTEAEDINQLHPDAAQLYYLKKEQLSKEKKLNSGSYKLAGAGFRSTPTDLVKMVNAYANGMISPKVADDMFTSHQLSDGTKTQVGIAWRKSSDIYGNKVIEHAGSWIGARTVVVYYPEEQLTISIMINAQCQVLIEETAHVLAQAFRNRMAQPYDEQTIQHAVEVTNRPNGEEEQIFDGQLTLQQGSGRLTSSSTGFLKDAPVLPLGQKGQYALVTPYGLLSLSLKTTLEGSVYIYTTRNSIPPNERIADVSLNAKQ